jgi:putative transposase
MDKYTAKKLTKEKRKHQSCRVFEVKVDMSKLSIKQNHYFNLLFTEAKWFYNYCLGQDDINNSDTKTKQVPVKVGDTFEDRSFQVLSSQMKQSVKTRLFNNMASLKALKEQGYKIGPLTFKSECNSIPLKQYASKEHSGTYYINFINNKMKVQGMKQWVKVQGLGQIPKDVEIASATLVRKSSGLYFHIVTFTNKIEPQVPNCSIGIDFGCESQMTFSNGIKLRFQVNETKRLKRLSRKINRRPKGQTKNKWKDILKLRKEYERLSNKKKDIRHKVVNAITKNFKYVCFQDEMIHAWHSGGHGKKVQHSGIGGIISDLKHKSVTPCMVERTFPSTKLCPKCDKKNIIGLNERTYICECGYVEDRDVKSSLCIEKEGLKRVPVDGRELTPMETLTSTFFASLSKINGVETSKLSRGSRKPQEIEVIGLKELDAAGLALR